MQAERQRKHMETIQAIVTEFNASGKPRFVKDPDSTALLDVLQHIYQQQSLLIERVHAPKWQQI